MPELPAATAAQLAAQLAELGETFQRSLPQRVGEVELALRALGEDWDQAALRELADATHRLAGAAGTFGHPVLGATALRMEELTRRLDADPAARGHAARAAFDGLLVELRAAATATPPLMSSSRTPCTLAAIPSRSPHRPEG
ncbi:MAG: Hpt domain-containing protein [Candidatus Accumulibacter sp.]|nr:Hpt domain-containing protein [Accumulibacter sp.]